MENRKKLTEKEWEELSGSVITDEKIDVDRAWNKVYLKIQESEPVMAGNTSRFWFMRSSTLKIAAAALLILGLGSIALYLNNSGLIVKTIAVTASADQRNLPIDLPDGSHIYLNRNSKLTYRSDFGKNTRAVKLTGEAFFDISPDTEKPFIIDAGKASIKVVGTSFNVLTENTGSAVEVFVKTGKVLLTSKSGEKSLILDPGDIGKMDSAKSEKTINYDPNYLAWNTGKLVYKNEKLEIVFQDLKKVYNMDIVADDPSILEYPWTSPIDFQPQDRIILMICRSFNLGYTKEGNVYHLEKK